MKWSIVTIFLALVTATVLSQSQQPVKVNLLEFFDKVPAPPISAKEAYDKCDCNIPDHEGECDPDSLFKPLTDRLGQIQLEIVTPNTPQGDLVKKMQDPEFQKKMEKMSDEEKMQLAMQMQASNAAMMGGPMKPESQSVIAAQKELGKMDEATANDLQNLNTNVQAAQKHKQEVDAKHAAVNDWETAELKKVPVIHFGGEAGDEPDPKAVHAVNINALQKHLAIVDEELKHTGKLWTEQREKNKQLFTPYEKAMEKIHYGDDAKNQITKQTLASGQVSMLGAINGLIQDSRAAYTGAIDWYNRYVQFKKPKTQ